MEVMTLLQIKTAWKQGYGGGNTKAHQNFTDEMCKKTVIGRLCKSIINNSDDSALFNEGEVEFTQDTTAVVIDEIKDNANLTEISLEETDNAPSETAPAAQPEPVVNPAPATVEGKQPEIKF